MTLSLNTNTEYIEPLLYGGAIGDALGAPFEYSFKRGSFTPSWTSGKETGGGLIGATPKGTWTDDTSMTIATIDSIATKRTVDADDLRKKYSSWVYDGKYTLDGECTDVGMTTMMALRKGHGLSDENNNGNGALMRISPLALTNASDDDIRLVSAVTHAHDISMSACVQWVHLLRNIMNGEWVDDAIIHSQEYMIAHGMTVVSKRLSGIWEIDEKGISSSGYVISSLEAAAWSLSTSSSYEETVLKAVALGQDTDTIACIAGSAAGALYGIDGGKGIPASWKNGVRGDELLLHAASQLENMR